MTGPEHWEEADKILTDDRCSYGCPHTGCPHEMAMLASAQVHATLAAAAALADLFALTGQEGRASAEEWRKAVAS